ncbi:hypothetical protein Tco_1183477 [Tanacetum coccineum]
MEKCILTHQNIPSSESSVRESFAIPREIDTDDDSEGDVPPFEEPLDDGLFPLPEVDILPIEVEPVEVMCNDSHTYGENFSQVERKFLSMVGIEIVNLSTMMMKPLTPGRK